jgi:hypothetical protein
MDITSSLRPLVCARGLHGIGAVLLTTLAMALMRETVTVPQG